MSREDASAFNDFLGEYSQYMEGVLQPTRRELREVFDPIRSSDYWRSLSPSMSVPAPSPVHRLKWRIKRPESVVDKILRLQHSFPRGLGIDSIKSMFDCLGGRIVVYFLRDLPLLAKEIHRLADSKVIEIRRGDHSPVAYLRPDQYDRLGLQELRCEQKNSGYASLHYQIRLRESEVPDELRPWVELQVRTLVEDVWAEVEHILGYKPKKYTRFAVEKQFQILADHLTAVDEHFNFIAEELARLQAEASADDQYSSEDPLNAENLALVLSSCQLSCAQNEVDAFLKILFSRGVKTVTDLKSVASSGNIELIKNTYRSNKGRPPQPFEIVACLATLQGVSDYAAKSQIVVAQIQFEKLWRDFMNRSRPPASDAQ